MMETTRLRGSKPFKTNGVTRKPQSRNKHWVADHLATNENEAGSSHHTNERWTRGAYRGGRGKPDGRKSRNRSVVFSHASSKTGEESGGDGMTDGEHEEEEDELPQPDEPVLETAEDREKFYQEVRLRSLWSPGS
ncbi:hypothetical protein OE88DRAFT_1540795 [Heliocybe sulcata]|uniref:Uncharacterized protein n=1 Tax=Heliocybe sulcata TaxID=5364 RepID=A0A5C3N2W3_9AGAM|nr:hypothetical protein OE88DRAFT_1540795 [Heliocybe sulcata]